MLLSACMRKKMHEARVFEPTMDRIEDKLAGTRTPRLPQGCSFGALPRRGEGYLPNDPPFHSRPRRPSAVFDGKG